MNLGLFVTYEPARFRFNIWFNNELLGHHPMRDDIPDIIMESVAADGSMEVSYIGFKEFGNESQKII